MEGEEVEGCCGCDLDIMGTIAEGDVCGGEDVEDAEGNNEDESEMEMEDSEKKKRKKQKNDRKQKERKKVIAGIYLVVGLITGVSNAVLEGITINDCTSAIPVQAHRGRATPRYNYGGNGYGENNKGNGGGWISSSTMPTSPWWHPSNNRLSPIIRPIQNGGKTSLTHSQSFAAAPGFVNQTFNNSTNSTATATTTATTTRQVNISNSNEGNGTASTLEVTTTLMTEKNATLNLTNPPLTTVRYKSSSKSPYPTATTQYNTRSTSNPTYRFGTTDVVIFSVDSSYGLYVWVGAFVVLITVLLPLQAWLLTHYFWGVTLWKTQQTNPDEQRNPYCIAYTLTESTTDEHRLCMYINRRLFMLFEDVVRIFLSVGRIYFVSESEANELAFREAKTGDGAMSTLIGNDVITFFIRWLIFYYSLPCKNDNACCKSFSKFLDNLFVMLTFATSASSTFFSVICPIYISQRPTPDDIAKYYGGWIGGVLLATVIIYWRCNRKSKKKKCCCFC